MKNLLNKRFSIVLIVAACICCSFSARVSAQEAGTSQLPQKVVISVQNQKIQPRADVIEMKYRFYYGIPQQRRWNRTDNCWVDPYWINC